ncbi:MAG: NAD-dependent epimerase/dehydratase family protein [Chloroflexi bacterium]|nr:NAD-dependent epimerase/dehydratase family protein [Chloroflexota bacterium]
MPIAFVTGANGFLGATLVHELLNKEYQVRVLLRPQSNDLLLRDLEIERISGDLLTLETYQSALAGCDLLFHVAASYTHDPQQLATMTAVNQEGTKIVLSAAVAAGIPHIVHTSTIGTIGQPPDGSLATEASSHPLRQPTAYVRSKLAGEQIAGELAASGAPIVIVHPTAMLGPGDWRPSASGRLVLAFLRGQPLGYLPGGINWCPVIDVAQGMLLAALRGQPGRHYILGHGEGNLQEQDFRQLLSKAGGRPPTLSPSSSLRTLATRLRKRLRHQQSSSTPAPEGTAPERLTCDPSRAIAELDMPQSDLLAAARASIQWYRQHGYI